MSDSEDSNNSSTTVKSKRKRVRAARACDQCFKRKVKCDCDEMPNNVCSVCLSLNIDCTHLVQKKKRGPKAKNQLGRGDAKTLITTILSARKTVIIPKDESVVREMLVDLASYARDLEEQVQQSIQRSTAQHSSASSPASQSSPPSQLSDDDGIEAQSLTLKIQSLSLNDEVYKRHVGKSSHFMLLQTALNIRDEAGASNERIVVGTKRTECWTRAPWHQFPPEPEDPPYEFPEIDLLRTLLNVYFDKHHPIYPLLHRPSFERQVYVENLHFTDRQFGALVLAVCALGSRLLHDPRTFYDESQDIRSAGWKYFGQIRFVRTGFVESPSLYDVQLYALTVVFVFPTPVPDISWFVLALGIRSAQENGVYRKTNFKRPMKSHLEEELWRRAFWNLALTDLFMSIATGRPRSTREDDFDLELPPECDDEYWEIPSNPQLEFIQPIGKTSHMSYWHYLVKLLHIAGLVKDHLFTTRKAAPWLDSTPDSNVKIVMELDSALNSWMDELPDHLKWDPHRPDDVLFSQTVSLHSNYYWVQIQLHKLFVRPGPLNTDNFPSLAICTNAARSYIHMLQVYHARPGMPLLPNYIAPTFIAAVILLINMWTSLREKKSYDPRKDMADVCTSVDQLCAFEQRYETAGRLRDVLEAVIAARQMPPIHEQKESLKRSHDSQSYEPVYSMQDNSVRQFAGTRRVSNALSTVPTYQEDGISGIDTDTFDAFAIPPKTTSPMFDPFFGVNIAPPEQQASEFNDQQFPPMHPFPSFAFDSSATGISAPSSGADFDDSDFAASLASAWNSSSHEDWTSFMSKVDDLLHVVNSDSF